MKQLLRQSGDQNFCGRQQLAARAGIGLDRLLYVLPRKTYFTEGRCGHVTHALGVIEGLAKNGVAVTVLTGPSDEEMLSTAKTFADFRHVAASNFSFSHILRGGWTSRLIETLDEMLIDSPGFNVVLVRYSTSTCHRFVPLMKKHRNVLWGFEINSLAYHQLYQLYQLPQWIRALVRQREARILSKASFLYVVSERLKHDILSALPCNGREFSPTLIVCPNAGPPSLHDRIPSASRGDTTRFAYLGVFELYYDLELVVDAFREIRSTFGPKVELHLFGDGPQYAVLHKLSTDRQGVVLHGRFELTTLIDSGTINDDMVLILPSASAGMTEIGSPVKLFEYMALGLPILGASIGQIAEVLKDGVTARLYRPGDGRSLVEAMTWMVEHPEARRRLGRKANRLYRRFHTWPVRMERLLKHLPSLAQDNGVAASR